MSRSSEAGVRARFLSWTLAPSTPVYPGTPGVTVDARSRIDRGDEANWVVVTMGNHAGTHVDGPWHFNPSGRRVSELAASELVFSAPSLIDLPVIDGQVIDGATLRTHADVIRDADLLLIRTGFGATRGSEPERYRHAGPGFDASAAWFLQRETDVRAVGFDFISATSQGAIDEGHEFHRITLGAYQPAREILIIEDVRLDPDLSPADLGIVVAGLLRLDGEDGGPVTLLAIADGPER